MGGAWPRPCSHSCRRVLGSFSSAADGKSRQQLVEQTLRDPTRSAESLVEVNGAEDGFKAIREDGRAALATGLHLAVAEPELLAEAEPSCDGRERLAAHEACAIAGQFAFARIRVAPEQHFRHDERKHGIAEVLETLVVCAAVAAMRQGPVQQRRVREVDAEALGEPAGRGNQGGVAQRALTTTDLSKSRRNETLPASGTVSS